MLIPFLVVPLAALLITYGATAIGFLHPFNAVQVPWTTPPVISGFILNGWRGALVQLIILVLSVIVYLPFMRKQDAQYLEAGRAAKE